MSTQAAYDDDIALAAEYVLHVLDPAERAAFEARLETDLALRDLVRDWERQLSPLAQDVAPVAPSKAAKARLERRLFARSGPARRPFWHWIAAGVLAASVIAAAVFVLPTFVPPIAPGATFTATVAAEDGSLVVVAWFAAQTNTLHIQRQAGGALPGRVLELWLIADGATVPLSLGVLPGGADVRLSLPPAIAGQIAGGLFAISDEPPGGSPTGAPTGAVLATGPVVEA